MDLLHLQNGSDIRGIAIGTADTPATLTPEVVAAIGAAFTDYVKAKLNKETITVAIGHDSRLSANAMFRYFCTGANSRGALVTYTGLSSTPAMFMATIMAGYEYDAGVMITASHLPKDKNGFKFFTASGGFEKGDIKAILTAAGSIKCDLVPPVYDERDIMDDYARTLRDTIIKKSGLGDKPLAGRHVIIDAGNGAGGFFETKVLQPLGADTRGSVFTEPNGNFPNHAPNPEDKTAMDIFSKAVTDSCAELGIIFDTDVDRSAVVLSDGSEINRNRLIALMTAIVCHEHREPVIVTDSVTSTGLADFIKAKGGIHRRFKRGYRNVINEAVRLCGEGQDACLAIETSGHGAMRENYFLDDGAYMAALIVAEFAKTAHEGKKIDDLIKDLKEPAESTEIRYKINAEDFAGYGKEVLSALKDEIEKTDGLYIAPDNFEGVRVNADKVHGDGWFLLRMSLHDPVMPLNAESNSKGGVAVMMKWIEAFVGRFEKLEK